MEQLYPNDRPHEHEADLKSATAKVETLVYVVALTMNICSAFLTGGCTFLYLDGQNAGLPTTLFLSGLIGLMTMGALITFSTAAVRLLPRLKPRFQLISVPIAALALIAFLIISGTSNATFLAHREARELDYEQHLAAAEKAFAGAQNSLRQLEQILPILITGRKSAAALKDHELRAGASGSGEGPIYVELMMQETRFKGAEDGISRVIEAAGPKIRKGRKVLERIREAKKDASLSRAEKERVLENGLGRINSIVIELRQQMPIASLLAVANMLQSAITLTSNAKEPGKRKIQRDTVRRLSREFKPIGISLAEAVTDLRDRLPEDVPAYKRRSPTAVVFAHAGSLAWMIGVGYALDILPYLAISLVLLARRQIETDERRQKPFRENRRSSPRRGRKALPPFMHRNKYANGKDHDHKG